MRWAWNVLLVVMTTVVLAVAAARFAFPLPDASVRSPSSALPADPATDLGRRASRAAVARPGLSGVRALSDGHDALSSRLTLIERAESSIDAQYYIWHDDTSGMLLLGALQRAARRGVRVRLLLDDNGVTGLDSHLAALHALDDFEVRLFNPSTVRQPKLAGYAFDFFRMNRRMHNKSLLVDGAAAIVGGRNIADEYFGVGDDAYYVDLDVLVVGAAVRDTATLFDAYWNSRSVFPVDSLIADAGDPVKGLGLATREQLMATRVAELLRGVERRLDLVSAYFIPGARGSELLTGLASSGRQVRVLTNAMRTTDVLMVHAGYSKYRRVLLEAGAELYELKPTQGVETATDTRLLPFGISGGSLHAKSFAIDEATLFVGSFNFDPRSVRLNTEMGFLIDSPTLASRIGAAFDGPVQGAAYRPTLTPEDDMVWDETLLDGSTVTHSAEPGATWRQRFAISIIGMLPVEWLL